MKATWNDQIIAESNETVVVENNHYFPADAVIKELMAASPLHTACQWKGVASYYTIKVNGKENKDAAWYYPNPNLRQKISRIILLFGKA